MGTFNTIHTTMSCPRCGVVGPVEIELKCGNTAHMLHLHMGDSYPWVNRVQPQNGGRPPEGNLDGDGYFECELCHKDSFLWVLIRNDLIVDVIPNYDKPGYVSD